MTNLQRFGEVSGERLEALGVKDVLCLPQPGDDQDYLWTTARLAVAASIEDGVSHNQIILNDTDIDGSPIAIAFGAEELTDGTVVVPTISGWDIGDSVPLDPAQITVFKELVQASINSGPR